MSEEKQEAKKKYYIPFPCHEKDCPCLSGGKCQPKEVEASALAPIGLSEENNHNEETLGIDEVKKAITDWYNLCYEPELTEEPQAVHWATKKLADIARELKK